MCLRGARSSIHHPATSLHTMDLACHEGQVSKARSSTWLVGIRGKICLAASWTWVMVADRGIPKRAPNARYPNLVGRYPNTYCRQYPNPVSPLPNLSTGTSVPEPRRGIPEPSRAAPEPRRAVPEPRRGEPEPCRQLPESWRPTRPWRIMQA